MNQELLRKLPKVDEILSDERVQQAAAGLAHEQAADAVRESINAMRQAILQGDKIEERDVSHDAAVEMVLKRIERAGMPSLRRVINATGVVLHTNLGRARLSEKAKEAVMDTADSYSTLEYDPAAGKRGSRHVHCEKLIQRITGAEAAMVVNNNAAATMLALAVLGEGKEIILSRGEMVEIGGSFRVPEIMETSGAFLKEIGTTNKTHLYDYERAINENTGALIGAYQQLQGCRIH
jgi:L-seryl-tRNA(Ser) seleniumtransferase